MEFIKWNDELSVSIPSIDGEHKKLIGLINDFYNGIATKSSREQLITMVAGLKNYTAYHFSTEENYMRQHDFPGLADHKAQHDSFVAKVNDFSERLEDGRFVVSLEITNFIKDWITGHIMGTDKKYSAFLRERGVS